jgi:LmbE family N-acetylglucosaminyl deacetylase
LSAVLFAAHNDDETLFAFYQCLRHQPLVIFVLRSFKQWTHNGPSYMTRESESACAMQIADCDYDQWPYTDNDPPWDLIAQEVADLLNPGKYDTVICPAWELGGHEDHNAVASIVGGIEGDWQSVRYLTYRRGFGRTEVGKPTEANESEREKKSQALACYKSQRRYAATAEWFPGGAYATLDEWTAD